MGLYEVLSLLEKTLRLNFLYDFYHPLLTKKQRKYMKMYYFDDLSLAEISDVANVSRQAIYDTLKRTEQILESYEEKLSLYEKYEKRRELLSLLEQELKDQEKAKNLVQRLKELG